MLRSCICFQFQHSISIVFINFMCTLALELRTLTNTPTCKCKEHLQASVFTSIHIVHFNLELPFFLMVSEQEGIHKVYMKRGTIV